MRRVELAAVDLGEEAEAAEVDAEDRDAGRCARADREQRAVAAEHDHQVVALAEVVDLARRPAEGAVRALVERDGDGRGGAATPRARPRPRSPRGLPALVTIATRVKACCPCSRRSRRHPSRRVRRR